VIRLATLRQIVAVPELDLGVFRLLNLEPRNARLKLITLVIQKGCELGIGYFFLVDPEWVERDGVWVEPVRIWQAAHLKRATGDVDHDHVVGGTNQSVTEF
jgi:hypothetical protein